MSESQLFSNFQPDYDFETPCFGQKALDEYRASREPQGQQIEQAFAFRNQPSIQDSLQDVYASTTLQQSLTDLSLAERGRIMQRNTDGNMIIRGSYLFNETNEVEQDQLKKENKILWSDERFKVSCIMKKQDQYRLRVRPLKYWLGQTKRTLKNDAIQILKRISVCQALTGLSQCSAIISSTYLQRNQRLFGSITLKQGSQIKIDNSLYGISKIRSDPFNMIIQEQTLVISKFGQKQFGIFRRRFTRIRNDLSSKVKLKITLFKLESLKQQT